MICALWNEKLFYLYTMKETQCFGQPKKNKKMATIIEVKQAIENKGFKTDFIKAEDTKHNRHQDFFGFTANGNVWFWFSEDKLTNSPHAFFDHRFNQGNGSVIRTFKQELKALDLLGLDF